MLLFPVYALIAVVAIVITATYVLRLLQRIFQGPFNEKKYADLTTARTTEWVASWVLGGLLLLIGIYPTWLANLISGSLGPLLR